MTGIIGFIIGALCIGAFALTSTRAYRTVPPQKLYLFTTAFGLLAVTMLVWAWAVVIDTPQATKGLMLASDALLLLASGCMLQLLLPRTESWLTVLLGLAGSLLLGLRAFAYPAAAFVHDGLLYFNLQTTERTIIVATFLLIWLPAVTIIAGYNAKDTSLASAQNILTASFASLIVVTALFLAARRSFVIIGLFATVAALFLAMTVLNLVLIKLQKAAGAKHATPARVR